MLIDPGFRSFRGFFRAPADARAPRVEQAPRAEKPRQEQRPREGQKRERGNQRQHNEQAAKPEAVDHSQLPAFLFRKVPLAKREP